MLCLGNRRKRERETERENKGVSQRAAPLLLRGINVPCIGSSSAVHVEQPGMTLCETVMLHQCNVWDLSILRFTKCLLYSNSKMELKWNCDLIGPGAMLVRGVVEEAPETKELNGRQQDMTGGLKEA